MDLGTAVNELGRLIGVLTGDASDVSFNGEWFQNPVGEMERAQTRLDALAGVIGAVLGPAVSSPPDVFPGACWYTVPNPVLLAPTVFHVVAGSPDDASGQLGGGLLQQVQLGALTVTAYGYFPLFAYGPAGATPLVGTDPWQVGLNVTASAPFQVDGVSFTALDVAGSIYLSDTAPTFTLTFENLTGTSAPATYTSLDALLDLTVAGWLAEVVAEGGSWLDTYLSGYVSIGQILAAAGYLSATTSTDSDTGITTTTYAPDLSQLQGKTAGEIALGLVFQALDALSAVGFPLISLTGGGVSVAHDAAAQTYGVRVQTLVSLSGDAPAAPGAPVGGASPAPPGFDVALALGAWMTGETDDASWVTSTGAPPAEAGIILNLLLGDAESCRFAPSLSFQSVGVNVTGAGGAPLASVQGVSLGAAELRASYDPAAGGYGFATRLEDVGFPLAPPFPGGGGGNPVAANLLASGSDPAAAEQTSATSPAFSAQAAYVSGYGAGFRLLGPDGTTDGTVWFPVQRRFGPVNCQRIGVGLGAGRVLDLVFDGGVDLGGLSLYLDQFTVGVPLGDPADVAGYSLDLQGLDVAFAGPGVQVGGGLLKMPARHGGVEYDGQALLQAGGLAVDALGSYATVEGGAPSLFVFAWLNQALGGPACCYVTGLAAGFGYNRTLRIPAQGQVQEFPLVAGLSNPELLGGAAPSPASALAALADWVPPARGEYWLAAGVQFTSFGVVNTNALVVAELGQQLTVAVLGVSTLRQPQSGVTWVYAELGVEAVLQPDQGEFYASAVLAPGSYVITPDAHLTGGFAFAAWWGSSLYAGDFVFTLGGYHPAFVVPDHYPRVPRLGINWQFDANTSLVGGGYFALTPVAMMAGADLQLTYALGGFSAWLRAQCDAIVFWNPFYVVASASISIGVSYRFSLLFIHVTLSVELGADFELWGPPVGFRVHVDWYIVSFTIGSGAPSRPTAISWNEFKGMLPARTTASGGGTLTTPAYLAVTVNSGLTRRQTVEGLTLWLVRPGDFAFTVASAVPATQVVVQSGGDTPPVTFTGGPVALRNVDGGISSSRYRSTQTVVVLQLASGSVDGIRACMAVSPPCAAQPAGCTAVVEDLAGWNVDVVAGPLPQAMWGEPVPPRTDPDVNGPATVSGTLGVRMAPLAPVIFGCTPQIMLAEVFADRTVNASDQYALPVSSAQAACPTPPAAADSFAQIARVNDPATAAERAALSAALTLLGASGWTDDPLPLMAADPGMDFADEPLEGTPVCAA